MSIPICQGFTHFPAFLYHFVLAKLTTSSIGVRGIVIISLQTTSSNILVIHVLLLNHFQQSFSKWKHRDETIHIWNTSGEIFHYVLLRNALIYIKACFTDG